MSANGRLISLPPGEVSIGTYGVLSASGGAVGVMGVFTFPSGTLLKPEGANRYVAPAGTAAVISANAKIHQGAIESANQDAVQGTLDLLMMQRQAEMMQKALTVFHTELNKTACEDIPRV